MKEASIFAEALSLKGAERESFLDRACDNDADLRLRIDAMLQMANFEKSLSDEATTIIQEVAASPKPRPEAAPSGELSGDAGRRLGSYQLLKKIGEGGFGVVFLAEQSEPIKRTVALKVIKPGMDSREVIARFEAERQALALMDHPGIANVLDAGTTEAGRPYFVMDLVEGQALTHYCDGARLGTLQRLRLFRDICAAVQHAHQKGVIHRDLKPSNILVADSDGEEVIKIIDFGIAKSLAQALTEKTLFTLDGQVMGTPIYMSPEQAGMSEFDIDTRSDVYSLGVILYELLTARTPFDVAELRKAGLEEVLRRIREEVPPKPSTRLGSLSQVDRESLSTSRGELPASLNRRVRGDLDWVVMKALEKDRDRRYESAAAFSEDVRRYLDDEPVEAGPPSAVYRMKKFVRRNRTTVVAGIVVALALIGGTAISIWQAVRAVEAEGVATGALQEVAQNAGEAHLLLAEEKLKRANWPSALAHLAESLRQWPENREAWAKSADLLFDGRAFCADIVRPENGWTLLAAGYPRFLLQRSPEEKSAGIGPSGRLVSQGYREAAGWLPTSESAVDLPGDISLRSVVLLAPGQPFLLNLGGERLWIRDLEKSPAGDKAVRSVPIAVEAKDRIWGFSPDGRFFVVSSKRYAEVIDLQSAMVTWQVPLELEAVKVALGGKGSHLVAASRLYDLVGDGAVRWTSFDGSRGGLIDGIKGSPLRIFSEDNGSRVAVHSQDFFSHHVQVYELNDDGGAAQLGPPVVVSAGGIAEMGFIGDSPRLAISAMVNETEVRLFRLDYQIGQDGLEYMARLKASDGMRWPTDRRGFGRTRDGRHLAQAAYDREKGLSRVSVLDTITGRTFSFSIPGEVHWISGATQGRLAIMMLPERSAVENEGGWQFRRADVYKWDVGGEEGEVTRVLSGIRVGDSIGVFAISPDGERLAVPGPYPEQFSVHRVIDGSALAFARVEQKISVQLQPSGDVRGSSAGPRQRKGFESFLESSIEGFRGRSITQTTPVSIGGLEFAADGRRVIVRFAGETDIGSVGVVNLEELGPVPEGWSATDRDGAIGESVTAIEPSAVQEMQTGTRLRGSESPTLGASADGDIAFVHTIQDQLSRHAALTWLRQQGNSQVQRVLGIQPGYEVQNVAIGNSGERVLVTATESDETPADPSAKSPLAKSMIIWDPVKEKLLGRSLRFSSGNEMLLPVDDAIAAVAFSPEERRIAVADAEGRIALWLLPSVLDYRTALSPIELDIPPVDSPVERMAFLGDGGRLGVLYRDGHYRAWDVETDASFLGELLVGSALSVSSRLGEQARQRIDAWSRSRGLSSAVASPGDEPPPDWLPDFLEMAGGEALPPVSDNDVVRRSVALTTGQIAVQKEALAAVIGRSNPWAVWARWLKEGPMRRAVLPGIDLSLSEAVRLILEPEIDSSGKRVNFNPWALLRHRGSHPLTPFLSLDGSERSVSIMSGRAAAGAAARGSAPDSDSSTAGGSSSANGDGIVSEFDDVRLDEGLLRIRREKAAIQPTLRIAAAWFARELDLSRRLGIAAEPDNDDDPAFWHSLQADLYRGAGDRRMEIEALLRSLDDAPHWDRSVCLARALEREERFIEAESTYAGIAQDERAMQAWFWAEHTLALLASDQPLGAAEAIARIRIGMGDTTDGSTRELSIDEDEVVALESLTRWFAGDRAEAVKHYHDHFETENPYRLEAGGAFADEGAKAVLDLIHRRQVQTER